MKQVKILPGGRRETAQPCPDGDAVGPAMDLRRSAEPAAGRNARRQI